MTLSALLADFAPIDAGFQVNLYSLLVGLGAVIAIWVAVRRKPPLDAHLVKLEAAISGLEKSVEKLTEAQEKHAGHEIEIGVLKEKVRGLESQLAEDIGTQRRHVGHVAKELGDEIKAHARVMELKMQALSDTLNAEFRNLYRALGKTEGILETERDARG